VFSKLPIFYKPLKPLNLGLFNEKSLPIGRLYVIPLGNFNIFQTFVYQAFNSVFTPKGNVKGDNLFSQFYTSI
jgi:hypothetical protein